MVEDLVINGEITMTKKQPTKTELMEKLEKIEDHLNYWINEFHQQIKKTFEIYGTDVPEYRKKELYQEYRQANKIYEALNNRINQLGESINGQHQTIKKTEPNERYHAIPRQPTGKHDKSGPH